MMIANSQILFDTVTSSIQQQKQQHNNDYNDYVINTKYMFDYLPDNISTATTCSCPNSLFNDPTIPNDCTNHTLFYKILQFTKVIIIKIGRRYLYNDNSNNSILPIIIIVWIVSLICMTTIGFLFGRRWEARRIPHQHQHQQKQHKHSTIHSTTTSTTSINTSSSRNGSSSLYSSIPFYSYFCIQNWFSMMQFCFKNMSYYLKQHINNVLLYFVRRPNSNPTSQKQKQAYKQQQQQLNETEIIIRAATTATDDITVTTVSNDRNFAHSNNNIDNRRLVNEQHNDSRTPKITCPINKTITELCNIDQEYENSTRIELRNDTATTTTTCAINRDILCESKIPEPLLPKHIAVIMDGNRRYGKQNYQNVSRGHYDGTKKLLQFIKWCIAEKIKILTVYAFSIENWTRDPIEITTLMLLIESYCEELRADAIERNIRINILSTNIEYIPPHIQTRLRQLQKDTQHCHGGLQLNICLSYSGRNEIINVCQNIVNDVVCKINNNTNNKNAPIITEQDFTKYLLTSHSTNGNSDDKNLNRITNDMNESHERTSICNDDDNNDDENKSDDNNSTASYKLYENEPDLLIRTSGEIRISNFLLWQLAYTELFFVSKNWPEISKDDFLSILQSYVTERKRRFGK